jgi:glutamyl-tRNA reductase
VGISWRHRRSDVLGAFTIPREEREERVPKLAATTGVRELVYLATCNRVEIAFAIDGATPIAACRRQFFAALAGREPNAGEAEHTLRIWQGEGAAEHLFLMTAGLDSARVGESEISGQVREAIEQSRALGLLGPRLEKVFAEAMKVAKHVRPVTEGRIGKVSLSEIALRHVIERIERTPGPVALVGVSPMTDQCAHALAARGVPVIIVNRTLERAQALATDVGGESRSLDAFRAAPDGVEALIVATGAREPVFSRADLERMAARAPSGESPLVVDMGVPANVAPEDAVAADVQRIGMADISEEAAADRGRILMEFAEARAIVDDALTDLRRHAAERLIGPMIAQMRLRYRRTALEGVERLFERELAGLGETERDAIRRWAETLARRFAHVPSVGLRDLVFQSGPSAVEAFFENSEPDLARELHAAVEIAGPGFLEPPGDES